jgi:hypothetical protein
MGAVGGALIAFVLYQGFETAKPVVMGLLSSMTHQAAPEEFTDADRTRTQDLIVGMTKQRLKEMGIE